MAFKVALSAEAIEESVKANKPQRFQPVPAGKQNFTIFDVEQKEFGPNSKNPGDPYYSVDLRIDGGPHNGRKITRVMVPFRTNWAVSPDPEKAKKNPNGYPTNFVPFFQALGYDVKGKSFDVPEISEILGKPISARVTLEKDDYGYQRAVEDGTIEPDETPEDFKRNGVQNFAPPFEREEKSEDEDSFDLL